MHTTCAAVAPQLIWQCKVLMPKATVALYKGMTMRGAGEARHADEDSSVGESLAHVEAREALDAIIAAALHTLELGADASTQQVCGWLAHLVSG